MSFASGLLSDSYRPRLCKNSDTLSKFALVLKF
ncbi:Uncharacterised protein [Pseudomonas putida]|nr:Uncharacterised protein [Pseudomonas putida]CAB5659849.1 Uncharacterised protein [Pseudomonas putida]CAB5683180.1 Uncharacterised protein [Pseudomonas putida]CAC9686235.1 Uncharacterised protein [Pseudomonas putida]